MTGHLLSGGAFLSGMLLAALGGVVSALARKWWGRALAGALAAAGGTLAGLSAVPAPPWVWWSLGVLAGVWLLAQSMPLRIERGSARVLGAALALCCLAAAGGELRYRRLPEVSSGEAGTVYVIGDSLSAGTGEEGEGRPWPVLLGRRSSARVVNLAKPGATLRSALKQVRGVGERRSTVILEIGGNDLIAGMPVEDFAGGLLALIMEAQARSSRVLMFELPLTPGMNAYGLAQRRLAEEFEVMLIPRRVLAEAVTSGGGTLDGLHLSAEGHERLARRVARIFPRPAGGEGEGSEE
ncbi:MAG: SGNH/GDSL hydrolase family protein [Planctomycetota bacterium]|jgi:acyl-CoA thioesterase-1